MAESLNKSVGKLLLQGLILWSLGIIGAAATAEVLPDPLRPPAAPVADSSAPVTNSGPILQSVFISSGRKVAVINGQSVQVGDKIGEARVLRIAEGEVVLAQGKESQTLKLFPGLEKHWSAGSPAVKINKRRQ